MLLWYRANSLLLVCGKQTATGLQRSRRRAESAHAHADSSCEKTPRDERAVGMRSMGWLVVPQIVLSACRGSNPALASSPSIARSRTESITTDRSCVPPYHVLAVILQSSRGSRSGLPRGVEVVAYIGSKHLNQAVSVRHHSPAECRQVPM
ncbi:hypothetical protein GGS23DRAFT_201949 [Durotheca rogersii]|uniref:uncharacterized protein n=1 Tax=Durotheca rogersii TaxID=419775 RepID=UPI00221EFE86|nr:uncharacterized protein GGS23DRAFT_201949 [Durotheca rogersii]KAI5860929.1 hypothetical protein GGS23DRAFT_201949 [Durotheca rogersii]